MRAGVSFVGNMALRILGCNCPESEVPVVMVSGLDFVRITFPFTDDDASPDGGSSPTSPVPPNGAQSKTPDPWVRDVSIVPDEGNP